MQNRAVAAGGVLDVDVDQPRGEQPLDVAHRLDEPRALLRRSAARAATRASSSLRRSSSVALGAPGVGEPHRAHAPVGRARLDRDEPVALERAEQAAEVAGVEVEPRAQGAQVGARRRRSPTAPATRRAAGPARGTRRCSAPMRCVTLRLNERTCRVAASSTRPGARSPARPAAASPASPDAPPPAGPAARSPAARAARPPTSAPSPADPAPAPLVTRRPRRSVTRRPDARHPPAPLPPRSYL